MAITEVTIIHHVGIVLLVIWALTSFNVCHPLAYFISLIYLYMVHDLYAMRFRRKVQFEERRHSNQKRVLSDSESVRWLNHAVEKIWLICMEEIVSQKILLPIIPWFLQKYKPWTVKEAVVQNLYMGRSPPMFTEIRVCRQSTDDDHLVLELGMNFRTAEDMSAILAVKLTKRLGFGMWAKMHLTGMHVEGKVLVGVKFLPKWPFIGRLRVCFVEPPYFQMTVKPMFAHGLDVTELPGIAGWLDKLLTLAFEETLVEPNMLVVDVEKFVSPQPEPWFSVDAKEPVAYTLVEVVEASDMKPSDLNGLADPYVKGQLGAYRFRTKTQKKTLSPKWQEEFKIPISTWDSPNTLTIEVRDKDHFVDDSLGDCCIKINDLRGGQRHDMWLPLQNIKMGRLHLAIRVIEVDRKTMQVTDPPCEGDVSKNDSKRSSFETDTADKDATPGELPGKAQKLADNFEPVDIEGQKETGIWIHHPGSEVPQVWEPRKGKNRVQKDSESVSSSIKSGSYNNDSSSTDEDLEGTKSKSRVRRGLRKIGSVFHRGPRSPKKDADADDDLPLPTPRQNVRAVNERGIGVNLVMEDNLPCEDSKAEARESPEGSGPDSPTKKQVVKGIAKTILKHAGNSARSVKHALSRKDSKLGRDRDRDRDLSVESDSSCEGSIPSSGYEGEPSPRSIPGYVRSNSTLKSEDVAGTNPGYVRSSSMLKPEDVAGAMNLDETATDSVAPTEKVN